MLLFLLICAFCSRNARAKYSLIFNCQKNKIGFITGNGIQYLGQLLGNNSHAIAIRNGYFYQVRFYQLQFYHTLSRKKNSGFDLIVQPQYNTTKYKMFDDDDLFLYGHELGLNIGGLFRKNTSGNRFSYYVLLSSGPHYVSGTPHRQTSGFIFSNNLALGLNLKLYRNLYADVRSGLRHISNAGFKLPNAGVNDITLNEGVIVVF